MRVRALFFAVYRDLAGTDELALELPAGARLSDLLQRVRSEREGLDALPREPVMAVNLAYAPPSTPLNDGDEVAFIPPVAGG
ncbi:hypothetical protein BH23GEM4_BH23GEM4_21200 [soil metagenome]